MRISDEIKLELMNYFRFERGYHLVCSEGIHGADVNAYNGTSLIEIEIKISKSDFKKEFKTVLENRNCYWKEYKHSNYENPKKHMPTYIVPNRFYFCVPVELGDWALDFLKDKNPKYGLLLYDKERWTGHTHIIIKKNARNLHNDKQDTRALLQLARRASNELITAKQKYLNNKKELEALKNGIITEGE